MERTRPGTYLSTPFSKGALRPAIQETGQSPHQDPRKPNCPLYYRGMGRTGYLLVAEEENRRKDSLNKAIEFYEHCLNTGWAGLGNIADNSIAGFVNRSFKLKRSSSVSLWQSFVWYNRKNKYPLVSHLCPRRSFPGGMKAVAAQRPGRLVIVPSN